MQLNRGGRATNTRMNVDDARLKATVDAFVRSRQGVSDSVDALSGAFVEVMARFAPEDTGRYRRAWIQAGRMAGVTNRPLGGLSESRYADRYEDALEAQRDGLKDKIDALQDKVDQWFGSRGLNPRASKGGRQMVSRIRKLQRRLEAAQRELDRARQGGPYILVYGRRERRSAKTGRMVGGRITTIRRNVPGGTGSRLMSGNKALIRLENHEPHAFLVEKRTRAGRRAMSAARGLGLKRAGRAYLDTLNDQRRLVATRGRVASRRGLSKGLAARLAG